jgi:NADH:ubiquinone oxidoreductase subunit 4 (subunit M)
MRYQAASLKDLLMHVGMAKEDGEDVIAVFDGKAAARGFGRMMQSLSLMVKMAGAGLPLLIGFSGKGRILTGWWLCFENRRA